MGWLHKKILRPLLFRQDSEAAHNKAVNALARVSRSSLALGAVKATTQSAPDRFLVFLDPAGHPFCLSTMIPE